VRLRFTIRDLLWLTLVVALAVGWWLDHRRLTRDDWFWWRIEQRNGTTVISNESTDDSTNVIRLSEGSRFLIRGRDD